MKVNGEFSDFSEAFYFCRECDRPVIVQIDGKIYRLFPSGRKQQIRGGSMSKKHFIALADTIREKPELFPMEVILELAGFCQSQNANFKRERWLGYIEGKCGPCGGKVGK